MFLTLIDVFQNNGYAIRPIPWSAGTQLFVLFRTDLRALLATIAPRGANAAAARCLRHGRRYLEDTLGSSGIVLVAGEAKRFASVCVTKFKIKMLRIVGNK